MSGKISAKGAVITLDDSGGTPRNISTDVDSYEINQDAGAIEVTGFTEGSQNFVPGLPIQSVKLNVLYNSLATTGAWTVIKSILGSSTGKTLSVTPESGGQAFSVEVMLKALPVKGTPAGRIDMGSVEFLVMGPTAGAWA
jgi:hypothetical protein